MSSDTVDVTDETVGTFPSMTRALFAPSDPEDPGDANVNVAAFPAISLIVPLFNPKELLAL